MVINKKILALFELIDDPDVEVYETVAGQLMGYGSEIVPNLEELKFSFEDENVQVRIENLIRRVLFTNVQKSFLSWASEANPSLLKGALIIANYQSPNLDIEQALSLFEQIRRNVWLELNNFLSPLEQINVINSILYNYYKFHGEEMSSHNPDFFFLNYLLENEKGNAFSIGVIYLSICEALDVPVFAVDLPRQFVLGYFDSLYNFLGPDKEPEETVEFYIDPVNGMVYTYRDVIVYLKTINADPQKDYMQPLSSKRVMERLLEKLVETYNYNKDEDRAADMLHLLEALKIEINRS